MVTQATRKSIMTGGAQMAIAEELGIARLAGVDRMPPCLPEAVRRRLRYYAYRLRAYDADIVAVDRVGTRVELPTLQCTMRPSP